MDDEMNIEGIEQEDVIDAIADPESSEALELLELYFAQLNGDREDSATLIKNALSCAQMLYDAKRYEDVVSWLDVIATNLSDEKGPDSEVYMEFAESEELEELKLKATDKIFGDEEEVDDDFDDE